MSSTFKVVTLNKKHTDHPGRYVSKNPMGAAKKAFSAYCRRQSKKGRCAASLGLKETTKGSAKKVRYYAAHRRSLKPRVKVGNRTYKYFTDIHAVKPAN